MEAKLTSHEDHCEERSQRTANDIASINSRMEREAAERKDQMGRIHQRIDAVATAQASMQTTIQVMPEMIADKINISAKGQRIWTYSMVLLAGATVLWALVQQFVLQ